jgi:hypothetical protein
MDLKAKDLGLYPGFASYILKKVTQLFCNSVSLFLA